MKHTYIAAVLGLGLTPMAIAADKLPFPDVPAARQQAQEQGKPQLIIWYGSDWMPGAKALCAEWKKLPGMVPVVLGQYDDCLGQTGDTRNKTLPIECYNLPVAVMMDAQGDFMAVFSGETVRHADQLAAAVQNLLPKVPQFTELAGKAKSTQGVEAARAAGQALDLLTVDNALRHTVLKGIINKQDPQDETGYRALYSMDHLAMFKEINLLLQGGADGKLSKDQRDFSAAEAYVRKALSNPKLTGERRQQWLAGLYFIQKERGTANGKRDLSAALDTLRQIVAIDAATETGKGAARYIQYWDDSIAYTITTGFYNNSDHTFNFEKEWHVDVTPSVTGPGEYTFSLIPRQRGPVSFRDFRLVIDGKQVAVPANADPQKNTNSVDFTVPAFPAGAKVEVWLRAKNNSGWLDGTGVIEMKKK